MGQSEHHEQCAPIRWAWNSGDWRLKWLHAVPNGLRLTPGQARKAKAEGLKKGIPDLFLPYPSGEWHGLYLEMKTRIGRMSDDQKEYRDYCIKVGYKHIVPKSGPEAIRAIIDYIQNP